MKSAKALLFVCLALCSCGKRGQENAFRAKMSSLDWGDDTCYVYGHKTPDVDAVCSSLAYAELMRELGYNCIAKVSSPINNETVYISSLFGFEPPHEKTFVAPGSRLIATDHEEYSQSVDGARQARILQIIDHHQEGDMAKADVPFIRREMIGSTCTIVWELYKEAKVSPDEQTSKILLAGILSDTHNLSKANTVRRDSLAWQALTSALGLSAEVVAEIQQGMDDAYSDYSGMSDYEIFISDYKDYDMSSHAVGIGCVDWNDAATLDSFIGRMLAVMPEVKEKKDREMVFLLIDHNDASYILYCSDASRAVAEQAFGASVREGACYSPDHLSRKTDVVPVFTDILASGN